jgi:YbgC/YbaW family acyl-CoA thioester hydrolase
VSGFSLPVVPRYAEVDQQGVVFNGHYLTWFDEACTGFLDHLGVTYPGLIATGHDIQVVHSEIDYLAGVRWRDSVRVGVQCYGATRTPMSRRPSVVRTSMWSCRPMTGPSGRYPPRSATRSRRTPRNDREPGQRGLLRRCEDVR